MSSLVSAQGVTKRFGTFTAVDNVSFEINARSWTGVVR